MVRVQHGPADAGNVEEGERAVQESADGGLVGGIQHRPTGAAPASDLVSQL